MVYKSGKLDNTWQQGFIKKLRRGTLLASIVGYLIIRYIMKEEGQELLDPYIDVPVLLLFCLFAWYFGKRTANKIQAQLEAVDSFFYTMTESGILSESKYHSTFFTWDSIVWARRMGTTISLQLAHGSHKSLILTAETEARRKEALRYINAHIGKANGEQLIPPPLDMALENPVRFSASRLQLREAADATALLKASKNARYTRYVLTFFWAALLIFGACFANYVAMIIAGIFLYTSLDTMRRPGGSDSRVNKYRAYDLYADNNRVLLLQDNNWILMKNVQAEACYETPHCTICACGLDTYLTVDAGSELPPVLSAPKKETPKPQKLHIILLILLATLCATCYAYTFSKPWHLHCLLKGWDTEHKHALALAELPTDAEVEDVYVHVFDNDFNPLLKTKTKICPVFMLITMKNGEEHELYLTSKAEPYKHEHYIPEVDVMYDLELESVREAERLFYR